MNQGTLLNFRRAIWLGLGCILFVFLLFRLGAGEIVLLLLELRWSFVMICGLYACHQLVRTAAFQQCITTGHATFWSLFRIRLSGDMIQLLTSTGPLLAEPARAWLMRKQGFSLAQAFSATILEYLFYTFTSAAMAIAGLTYLLRGFDLSRPVRVAAVIVVCVSGAFLLAAGVAITRRIYLIGAIIGGLLRMPLAGKFIRIDLTELRHTEDLLFKVLRSRPARFLAILGIESAAQVLLVLELAFFLRATGQLLRVSFPFIVESAAKFISIAFFFVPAQIGAAEGAYAAIFQALGLIPAAGFSFAFVRRFRSFLVLGIGLSAVLLFRREGPPPAPNP